MSQPPRPADRASSRTAGLSVETTPITGQSQTAAPAASATPAWAAAQALNSQPPVAAGDALKEVARREAGRRLTVRERLALAQPGWLEDLLWRASDLREWARGVWDPGPILRADKATWAAAGSLGDLGELTAQWLRGELASQPGYHGPVDVDEADAPGLTDALVAVCRAGGMTIGSQAGCDAYRSDWGLHLTQLAWVYGFMPAPLVQTLQHAAEGTPYRVVIHVPGGPALTVTWVDGEAATGCDWVNPRGRHPREYLHGIGPGAWQDLQAAAQVSIVDPVPGRNTLWSWLQGVAEDWQHRCPVCDAARCPLCGAHGGYCGAGCPEGCSEVPPGPRLCDRCGTALTEAPDHPGDPGDPESLGVLQACGHCGSGSTAAGYDR